MLALQSVSQSADNRQRSQRLNWIQASGQSAAAVSAAFNHHHVYADDYTTCDCVHLIRCLNSCCDDADAVCATKQLMTK